MWWDKQELYDKERDKVEKVERERLKNSAKQQPPNEQLAEPVDQAQRRQAELELAEENASCLN